MREIIKREFMADSKQHAIYSLILYKLEEGFVVETRRGSGGKVSGRECYWRHSEEQAQQLFDRICNKKTRAGRVRVYKAVTATLEVQIPLFSD